MASTSIIQSSSSSSYGRIIKNYDVFVSFSGQDVRNNFADHLFAALRRKSILTFRDDTELNKGEPILSELIQAIQASQIFVIVLSKNYASSTWCLRELENILHSVNVSKGKHVLPIFYDVDPSEVRHQKGDYEKAFATHEERFKQDSEKMEEVKRWRVALTQVANLSGWHMKDKSQNAEIEEIVKIISILGHDILNVRNDLVGIDSPLEELENLLQLDAVNDVRTIGICGMGGVGKTTLASVLYDKIRRQYDAHCFIDVSKYYRKHDPIGVAKQLLRQTLNEENLQICNLYNAANLIQNRLRYVKSLIILDNVDQVGHLQELFGKCEWLGAGSRVLIISRDQHALEEFGVYVVYKVQLLNQFDAHKLFCQKAFKCDDIVGDYKELVYDVLKYANRLPLAVKVVGSFLCGRSVSEWRSALVRMKENLNKDILDVLQISYDGLQDSEKQIFLDIACFFWGYRESRVKNILDCCGFYYEIGIKVLLDKSLIDINTERFIEMHDLLKDLGRKIVKGNATKEPEKWNRLWLSEDFYNVMSRSTEITNTEAVVLRTSGKKEMSGAQGLSKMSNLRLLILHGLNFKGSLNCLSNKLHYIDWSRYPFPHLPSSFQPNKLVELILTNSNIKQLWKGIKSLPNLRVLNLWGSENLIEVPDFGGVLNLEKINLGECTKLARIHPSVGLLRKLFVLDLHNCKSLVRLPSSIFGISSLECLNISGCSKLFSKHLLEKPKHEEHSKMPDIRETNMQSQSTSSSIFKGFVHFSYSRVPKNCFDCLLPSLPSFFCLLKLDLSFCNLSQIPDAIGSMHSLESLNLAGNNFIRLPSSFNNLSKLVHLNLEHCQQFRYLPEMPSPTALAAKKRMNFRHLDRKGLLIFNCPKIVDIERCCGMTFAWLLQILQVNQESISPIDYIDIVIPGNQIPRWFNNQSVGTSISLDPSPIMQDNNWIGVICAVVFVVLDYPTLDISNTIMSISFTRNKYFMSGYMHSTPIWFVKDLITVKSYHLWLVYLTKEEFFYYFKIAKMIDLYDMEMKIMVKKPQDLGMRVTNCGYHWVFKEDLQNLNMRKGYNNIQVYDDFAEGSSILSLQAGK